MVITVGAILVALVIFRHVFTERFLALLAQECHLRCLAQPMVLALCVAFRAVEPLLTAGCPDCNLRVENMFTRAMQTSVTQVASSRRPFSSNQFGAAFQQCSRRAAYIAVFRISERTGRLTTSNWMVVVG